MPHRFVRRPAPVLALVLACIVTFGLVGCGGSSGSSVPPNCTPVAGGRVTLTALNLAWNTDCLSVPGPSTVIFTVKLLDQGVKHDLRVSGQGHAAQTELQTSPATQTLKFTFRQSGYYQYVCTIHSQMEGNIYVG